MRYKNSHLLDVLAEWIEENEKICPTECLAALVITLANVSYVPTNAKSLFNVITPRLTSSSFDKKVRWLDTVWSMTLLNKVTNDQVASVLNESFVSGIVQTDEQSMKAIHRKLLNVSAVAQMNLESYGGPYIDHRYVKLTDHTMSAKKIELHRHIEAMFNNFCPAPKYSRKTIQTAMGVGVDFEIATDKTGKPIPLQEKDLDNCDVLKPSEDVVKIAVLIWMPSDYTIGTVDLTGSNWFAVRILRDKGYKVVQIPHSEYNLSEKTLKNVQYLNRKIKATVLYGET